VERADFVMVRSRNFGAADPPAGAGQFVGVVLIRVRVELDGHAQQQPARVVGGIDRVHPVAAEVPEHEPASVGFLVLFDGQQTLAVVQGQPVRPAPAVLRGVLLVGGQQVVVGVPTVASLLLEPVARICPLSTAA